MSWELSQRRFVRSINRKYIYGRIVSFILFCFCLTLTFLLRTLWVIYTTATVAAWYCFLGNLDDRHSLSSSSVFNLSMFLLFPVVFFSFTYTLAISLICSSLFTLVLFLLSNRRPHYCVRRCDSLLTIPYRTASSASYCLFDRNGIYRETHSEVQLIL